VRILLTGSAGRIGRAIFNALSPHHDVVGLDRSPFSTTRFVGDVADEMLLAQAMAGADAIIHTAALHAPHVGRVADAEFLRINVLGLQTLTRMARDFGVRTLVYTSTTALYGEAVEPGQCTWIDERTEPRPKTIYHRTKLQAEAWLAEEAGHDLAVRVVRMSRCFPEQAHEMALYRLHRGIDARDVASAHVAALQTRGAPFQRYIASGRTPFLREDLDALASAPRDVLAVRCPALLTEFERRGWPLPRSIDRIYDASAAERALDWRCRFGFEEVLAQHDAQSLEVLPLSPWFRDPTTE